MDSFNRSKMAIVLVALVAANGAVAQSAFSRKAGNIRTLFASLRIKEQLDPQVAKELKRDAARGAVVLVMTGVGLGGVGYAIKNMLKDEDKGGNGGGKTGEKNDGLTPEQRIIRDKNKELLKGLAEHAAKKQAEWQAKREAKEVEAARLQELEKARLVALAEAGKNKQPKTENTQPDFLSGGYDAI